MPQPPKELDPARSSRALLGTELRHWRMNVRGMSARELGESVHVSGDLILAIETAKRSCDEELVHALDAVLGTQGTLSRILKLVCADADRQRADADNRSPSPSARLHEGDGERILTGHASLAPNGTDPVDRRSFLAVSGIAALSTSGLSTLVTRSEPVPPPAVIRPGDIEQIHTAATVISKWDNHYGGDGMVREAASAQLQWAGALLQADCREDLRADLFAAVARLGMVVGAAAFDAYAHNDGQRAFRFAAVCAEEADAWHLRAKIYSWLARQQIWLGNPDRGLTFAELGLARADRLTATEQAMLHTARARAFAKMGEVQQTLSAVGAADDAFGHARAHEDPPWMAYYDAAQHHGDTGHALYDLALLGHDPARAQERLRTAVAGHGDEYVRSRAISGTKLASLLMTTGDPAEAATIGHAALDDAGHLHSRRAADDVRELGLMAGRHPGEPVVAELQQRVNATVKA
ncbi:helix-turn-helix transcriptional regulator [Streptomyces sp. NPDC046977]|uniref:helix-turn-helix domain-containing protein n=1 Tax=Streptomyces sp. NPDC046977 TaxID=3154703 RepID=UPI0033DC3547